MGESSLSRNSGCPIYPVIRDFSRDWEGEFLPPTIVKRQVFVARKSHPKNDLTIQMHEFFSDFSPSRVYLSPLNQETFYGREEDDSDAELESVVPGAGTTKKPEAPSRRFRIA